VRVELRLDANRVTADGIDDETSMQASLAIQGVARRSVA
jgi:hypothetical protein